MQMPTKKNVLLRMRVCVLLRVSVINRNSDLLHMISRLPAKRYHFSLSLRFRNKSSDPGFYPCAKTNEDKDDKRMPHFIDAWQLERTKKSICSNFLPIYYLFPLWKYIGLAFTHHLIALNLFLLFLSGH